MQATLWLLDMPLDIVGAVAGELGVGGRVSGRIDYAAGPSGLPVGEARVLVDNLTRSSSLLTSQPLDIAFVGRLSETLLQARAVMSDPSGANGRLQARISGLSRFGALNERLYRGDLAGQMRYSGPASSLWRLAAIDLIDITGEVQVAANVTGTLGDPRVAGSLAGDALRLRSGLTGTDITNVRARGRFTGSRLNLSSFAGTAAGGGQVSGSGYIDLAGMTAQRGPRMDLRIAARNARLINLDNMGATVTGPLRIVSSGVGGTIAGRVQVAEARWRLGRSEVLAELPNVNIREINLPADSAPARVMQSPWRYLIDANAPRGIEVDGMGLDSEWGGNIRLRGTTADPRIGGEVQVVPRQGFYSFAGTRFELTRGRIAFDDSVPIDPRVSITAETNASGLAVTVNVTGSASQPDISFSSTPALPEEELLARLLFGGSITSLSATDALQLGAAVASLRGGSGIGPINQLRNAIGLDRLRIVAADPALGRGTSIALGKNVTRRLYVEIITDGAGYNASELEFRITSWLSLLGSVSTMGRHSVAASYRRDY
jgi:translocation and assembly module TamB